MDSKRLAVAFILWLIVSCVLLDYAEGFVLIGRQRQRKLMKRKRTRQTPSGVVSHPKTSKSWVCICRFLLQCDLLILVRMNYSKLEK